MHHLSEAVMRCNVEMFIRSVSVESTLGFSFLVATSGESEVVFPRSWLCPSNNEKESNSRGGGGGGGGGVPLFQTKMYDFPHRISDLNPKVYTL